MLSGLDLNYRGLWAKNYFGNPFCLFKVFFFFRIITNILMFKLYFAIILPFQLPAIFFCQQNSFFSNNLPSLCQARFSPKSIMMTLVEIFEHSNYSVRCVLQNPFGEKRKKLYRHDVNLIFSCYFLLPLTHVSCI